MNKRAKKRGQMELSFGTIFGIFLILAFIGVAIYVIYTFVRVGKCTNAQLLISDLQKTVDNAWIARGAQSIEAGPLPLDKEVEIVCFIDFSRDANTRSELYNSAEIYVDEGWNLFFFPFGSACRNGAKLEHVNISVIAQERNPYCIANTAGKISFTIEKKFGEALVSVR
jgi:hypothetical protein